MKCNEANIRYAEFEKDGFTVVPELVDRELIDEFERNIDVFCRSQTSALKTESEDGEPFIALYATGGTRRSLIYELIKELAVIHEMSAKIATHLRDSGFLDWAGIKVPLIWPGLRVDLPGEATYQLPMHQDYASTKCHNAWRGWVPLRAANKTSGSLAVIPGSHKKGYLPHDTSDKRYPEVNKRHYLETDEVHFELPAGDVVLFHPLLLHRSVQNRSSSVKFTLLIQIQDLATLMNPADPADRLAEFARLRKHRDSERKNKG